MTAIAKALMAGNASKWIERLTKLEAEPVNFAEFENSFLRQFEILDDENIARDKLKEIRQFKSVTGYISAFDDLVLSLPNVPEQEFIHAFIYGLKSPIKGFVRAHISQ